MDELVDRIIYKRLNVSDVVNMFGIKKPDNGGGQTYIELSGIDPSDIQDFCQFGEIKPSPFSDEDKPIYRIEATALSPEDYPTEILEIKPRHHRKGYVISNQTKAHRHPAWDTENNFPDITSVSDAESLAKDCYIYLIRTNKHAYFAGYVRSNSIPLTWPNNAKIQEIFSGEKTIGVISLSAKDKIGVGADSENPFLFISSVSNTPETTSSNDEDTEEQSSDFSYEGIKKILVEKVEAPTEIRSPVKNGNTDSGVHPNYKKSLEAKKKIGDIGEELAMNYEAERLHSIGLDSYISKIEHVSQTLGDGLGYDIKSYDRGPDGSILEIYIEVKSTIGDKDEPFPISANEVEVSRRYGESYKVYRLFKIKNKTKVYLYVVSGAIENNFDLKPTDFFAYKSKESK